MTTIPIIVLVKPSPPAPKGPQPPRHVLLATMGLAVACLALAGCPETPPSWPEQHHVEVGR